MTTIAEALGMTELDGEFVVTGVLDNVERRVTPRGNAYGIFGVTDGTGAMEGAFCGRTYQRLGHLTWDGVEVDLLCTIKGMKAGPMLNVLGMAPAWAGVPL